MLYGRSSGETAHDVVITGPVRFRAKNSARCSDYGEIEAINESGSAGRVSCIQAPENENTSVEA